MKKLLFILICFFMTNVQAMFIGVQDQSNQNRFLGSDIKTCSSSGKKSYGCGNDNVSSLLHINLLSFQNYGKQFYMFNDFVASFNAQSQSKEYDVTALRYSESQAHVKSKKDFPASGIYMIVLGSSDYLKKIIAPTKICLAGESLMMAQLKYNDGTLIYSWSQDAICMGPQDSFLLQISSDIDNTIPRSVDNVQEKTTTDAQGIDWMKDPGPSLIYEKATKSPRKIRLIKSGSR